MHDGSLVTFYYTARSILIHHEDHYDPYDQAFAAEYAWCHHAGLTDEMAGWLADAAREAA